MLGTNLPRICTFNSMARVLVPRDSPSVSHDVGRCDDPNCAACHPSSIGGLIPPDPYLGNDVLRRCGCPQKASHSIACFGNGDGIRPIARGHYPQKQKRQRLRTNQPCYMARCCSARPLRSPSEPPCSIKRKRPSPFWRPMRGPSARRR